MTPVVRALLIATVGAFFVQQTLPALASAFVFVPAWVLVRPWSVVTYMFLHAPGITHILFNMLALFFFGPRVEDRLGSRNFAILYFVSGIAGALLSAVLSRDAALIGASAGVFGVTLAFAYFWPDAIIHVWGIVPVPARMMVIVTAALSLWAGYGGRGNVAHFAHLGGYAGAYLYLKWLERGRTEFKRKAAAAPPARAADVERYRAIDRTKLHAVNREEVDRILDKISAQGIAALTPQERLFLSNFTPMDDRKPPVS